MKYRIKSLASAASLLGLCLLAPASRAASINFVIDPDPTTSGSISFAGIPFVSPLVGSGIEVDALFGFSTPANDGTILNCMGCLLDFETGPFLAGDSNGWLFAAGGSISITGGVDLPSGPDIPAGSTLLSGTFSNFVVSLELLSDPDAFIGLTAGELLDSKSPLLVDFFGLPAGSAFHGALLIDFVGLGSAPGPFVSLVVGEGLVLNEAIPVPESNSLTLLVIGLCTLLAFRFMRRVA